jgi:hypothetical protein
MKVEQRDLHYLLERDQLHKAQAERKAFFTFSQYSTLLAFFSLLIVDLMYKVTAQIIISALSMYVRVRNLHYLLERDQLHKAQAERKAFFTFSQYTTQLLPFFLLIVDRMYEVPAQIVSALSMNVRVRNLHYLLERDQLHKAQA